MRDVLSRLTPRLSWGPPHRIGPRFLGSYWISWRRSGEFAIIQIGNSYKLSHPCWRKQYRRSRAVLGCWGVCPASSNSFLRGSFHVQSPCSNDSMTASKYRSSLRMRPCETCSFFHSCRSVDTDEGYCRTYASDTLVGKFASVHLHYLKCKYHDLRHYSCG